MIEATRDFKKGEQVGMYGFKVFRPGSLTSSVTEKCLFLNRKYILPEGEGQLYEKSPDPNLYFEIEEGKVVRDKKNKAYYKPGTVTFKAETDIKVGDYLTIGGKPQ